MNRHEARSTIAAALVVIIAWTGLILFSTLAPAKADQGAEGYPTIQPYGGCKEALLYPYSAGADWCRAHGWTITYGWYGRNVVVNPHGVVVASRLPHCHDENGTGTRWPCSWNFDSAHPGTSFWIGHWGTNHYVWPTSPINRVWHWVDDDLAKRLAHSAIPGASTYRWTRCVVAHNAATDLAATSGVVRCPNGHTWNL